MRWWRALASRTQTRKKTRPSAEKSVAEGSGSRRQTITKINSGKTAATSSSTETKLDGEPVLRRQTRTRSKTKPAPAEVVEPVPAARRLTRTKTKQSQAEQAATTATTGTRQLTKAAASPRVRELAAAVMSPAKRATPPRTVGYTGSPIRDRVKVFEQAMKESAGLKSGSDSEKEATSTPSRQYVTPDRRSSIARSLRKVSAARKVPVATIISESSVELSDPPRKGPVIRKSPPKPKESLNNSRAPAGKIVKPGRKVGASGGRGVSPATGPRSGTGSSSLMKSRSRMDIIQRAGRTTPQQGGRTTPSGKGPANLLTGVGSFLPQKPKGPTLEEIQAKKDDERKQKEQREIEARQRREEQLKSKAEEAKRQREERIKRVQEARKNQESKKEQEIARKEKENQEKLAVLKKREEMHKEAEKKKKRELEEQQREDNARLAREEDRRKEQLRKEEEIRKREQLRREEERRKLEERKKAAAKAEMERIRREREEMAKLKEREAARAAEEMNSTYNKPGDSTFSKPADSTFSKPMDSTFNRTVEQSGAQSYDITPARHELPPKPPQDEENYGKTCNFSSVLTNYVFQCLMSSL